MSKLRNCDSYLDSDGYRIMYIGYLDLNGNGWVQEHHWIAEQVLGRKLSFNEVVHHINEVRCDNRNENLLICTQSYHMLIHQRMRAVKNCGNPSWRKCKFCKIYDDPINLEIDGKECHHITCLKIHSKAYCLANKERRNKSSLDYYYQNKELVLAKKAEYYKK